MATLITITTTTTIAPKGERFTSEELCSYVGKERVALYIKGYLLIYPQVLEKGVENKVATEWAQSHGMPHLVIWGNAIIATPKEMGLE